MTDFSYDVLRGGTGVSSDNPVENLVNAARGAACALYNKSPGMMLVSPGAPDPTGFGANLRAMYDNMCADKGLPPAPEPPFSGGQCANRVYNVSWTFNNGQPGGDSFDSGQFHGPIGPVYWRTAPGGSGLREIGFEVNNANGQRAFRAMTGAFPSFPNFDKLMGRILSVTPVDGQPDNCGDPKPQRRP